MSIMNTYTGKKFDPINITIEDVCLEDIAHALSLLCRGGGHLNQFYSVGQHSINCAKEAWARGWSERIIFACLMHDASEAYISDVIRPVKVYLSNYLEIEEQIMRVILNKFGLEDLSQEEMLKWKQIDDELLEHELKMMMKGESERTPVKLSSAPNFQEQMHLAVEEQFLDMAAQLIKVLANSDSQI